MSLSKRNLANLVNFNGWQVQTEKDVKCNEGALEKKNQTQKDGHYFVGYSPNAPRVVTQADSMSELTINSESINADPQTIYLFSSLLN